MNGGECENLVDGFICHCTDGYEGVYCQFGTLLMIFAWNKSHCSILV